MSISRLSNHLYVVVTTIISLLVAPSTFHQARASSGSHDFTESRQFKRNLAVSRYRDNPHWLPNYTWKPPEKFYGPRKRPAWEVDTVTESETKQKERKELEEWEKKMRDVSNRQREKWKTYEAIEKSEPKNAEKVLVPIDEFSDHTTINPPSNIMLEQTSSNRKTKVDEIFFEKNATSPEKEIQDTLTDASDRWKKNLHNGRWGMSAMMPGIERPFTNSPTTLEKTNSVRKPGEGATHTATISNGRWGMSVEEAPKELSKQLSRRSQTPGRVWEQDKDPKLTGNRKIDDGAEVRVKGINADAVPIATNIPKVFPNGRWGMSLDLPPREFLREISSRGLAEIPGFYRPEAVHQRAQEIATNNPRLRGLVFSQMPGILNIVFLQPFPSIIREPTFPSYFMMDPRIWPSVPTYNVMLYSHITSQSNLP